MSYPLRLPSELDFAAREHCSRLGISLNALVAVALDEYLGAKEKTKRPRSRKPPARESRHGAETATPPQLPSGLQCGDHHPDPRNFRNWHPVDMWPLVDPEFAARWEGVDPGDAAACEALESEYWATRRRPV